jgi:hypothetical protein
LSVKFDDGDSPYLPGFAAVQELHVHGAATAKPTGADTTLAGDFLAFTVNEDKGKFRQALHFLIQL